MAPRRVANSAADKTENGLGSDTIGTEAIYFRTRHVCVRSGRSNTIAMRRDKPASSKSVSDKIRARQDCFGACFGII